MSQYVINIGSLPNDGTGDPLRTAFNDVNLNFNQVFAAGPVLSNIQIANNTILTTNTNGNLVLAPNGIGAVVANVNILPNLSNTRNLGSSTLRWASLYTRSLDVTGVINLGNVANLHISGGTNGYVLQTDGTGNLNWVAQSGSGNGNPGGANTQVQFNDDGLFSGVTAFTFDQTSNTLSVPNVVTNTISSDDSTAIQVNDDLNISGDILPGANVTYSLGSNIAQWKDLWVSNSTIYMNSVPITLGAGNVLTVNGNAVLTNNSNTTVSTTGNITSGNVLTGGVVSATGNVTGNYILGNGSQLTSLPAPTVTQDITSNGAMSIMLYDGNIKYNNYATVEPSSGNISAGNISTTGNIAGNYFIGNGSQLTGISGGNANTGNLEITGTLIEIAAGATETSIVISPSGPTAGQAFVDVPDNVTANTANLRIYNNLGNIELGTNSGNSLWSFDATGNLNLPTNGDINFNGGSIAQTLNEDIYIRASDDENDGWSVYNVVDDGAGNILSQTRLEFDQYTIRTDAQGASYTWAFRDTGVLELPGDIYGNVGDNLTIKIGDQAGSDTFIDLQTRSYIGDALISNIRIANPNVTISTAGGANTWTFDDTGYLTVPGPITRPVDDTLILVTTGANGNSSSVSIDGEFGRTLLRTNDGNTLQTWEFDIAGNLTVPGNIGATNSSGLTIGSTYDVQIVADQTDNNRTWAFSGVDGTLTFPRDTSNVSTDPFLTIEGGDTPTIQSTDVSQAGPANLAIVSNYLNLSGYNGNTVTIFADDGVVSTSAEMTLIANGAFSLTNYSNTESVYITTDANNGLYQWSFDNSGNLTLPGNTFAVNYANGTQVNISGGGSANTGNVTFNDQIVIGSGDEFGGGGLYLAPAPGSIANSAVQYLRVRGGDFPTHIHLDTGNNQYFDQYFGADNKFVKLEANGNIVINADDNVSATASWTFDVNGTITLPPTSTAAIQGTVDNDVRIRAVSSGDTVSASLQNYNGNTTTTSVSANPDAVIVDVNDNTWTFDDTGNLAVPGSLISDTSIVLSAPTVFNVCTIVTAGSGYDTGSSLKATTGGSGTGMTVGIGYGLSNQLTSVTVVDPGTGYVNGDVITVSEGTGGTFELARYNDQANQANNNTIQTDLTFANSIVTLPTYGEIESNANLVLTSNAAGNTTYSWMFGANGTLTVPYEGIIQSLDDTVILQSKDTGTGNIYSARLGTNGGLYFATTEYPGGWLSIENDSGNANITSPSSTGGAAGHNLTLTAGATDQGTYTTLPGGDLNLVGGLGGTDDGGGGGPGGNVNLIPGLSADPAGVAGNVNITAGTETWTFNNVGELAVANLTIAASNGIGASAYIVEDNGSLEVLATGTNGVVNIGWENNASTLGNTAVMWFNEPGNVGNAVIRTGNTAATSYAWAFDNTGRLSLATVNDESSQFVGTRKIIGGALTGATAPYSVTLAAGGTPTVAYTGSAGVQSTKVTFAVASNGAGFQWEQFDVVAVPSQDVGGAVNFVVSNRVKGAAAIPDTVVTATMSGSQIQISLTLDAVQTSGGTASFDATEFGLMVD